MQVGANRPRCGEKGSLYQTAARPGISSSGGGRVGAVLISPFITPGHVSKQPYKRYSLLCSVEDVFWPGLSRPRG